MTLANTSSPIEPVPNGWKPLGDWYRPRFSSAASYFQRRLPNSENSTSRTKMASPIRAARCRKKRRETTCHCLRGAAMSRPELSSPLVPGEAMVVCSAKANPRVEVCVQDVRYEVERDNDDRGQHHHTEDH